MEVAYLPLEHQPQCDLLGIGALNLFIGLL